MIDFIYLIVLGLLTIVLTKYLLIEGIQCLSIAWKFPSKVRGQILGYATSVPELVGTVGTASKGLLGAGLWNIASSNIINVTLFFSALLYYRRQKALMKSKFLDELGFSICAIIIPVALVALGSASKSIWTALGLFVFFVLYLIIDKKLNPQEEEKSEKDPPTEHQNQLGMKGIILVILGLIGVVIVGNYLGIVAEKIVKELSVPQWGVGWILGFITSLPELTTFFAVFAAGQTSPDDEDCQEALDNLAASNMSNLGLIYPIGIVVFLWVGKSMV
jgi:cation:H+ antiporter